MELRGYYIIARRWWWLILLPPLVIGAYGLATYRPAARSYAASVRYTASQPAALVDSPGYDPNYYRWLTSEYIVNALKDWVRTGDFARSVSAELASRGVEIPAAAIGGALAADSVRSVLVVYLTWPDAAQTAAILDAATSALQAQNAAAFPQLGGLAAMVVPLDTPVPGPVAPSLRARLDLPLKVAWGLAVGLGLALAAHYFDPFVREKRDLDHLGLPVVGEIPRSRKS